MKGNLRQLIDSILANEKMQSHQSPEEKVYKDEPILFSAAQMKSYTPPQIAQMKKLARSETALHRSAEWIFYTQGKFMEDFEDDYEYTGSFSRYYPTYQAMNDFQLRGYFTWRTRVRRGDVRKTELSFVFVYLYELLNGIGVRDARDGLDKLLFISRAYEPIDPRIRYYTQNWIRDYLVYYHLPLSLCGDMFAPQQGRELTHLYRYDAASDEEIYKALCQWGTYSPERSRFCKENPELFQTVAVNSYRRLSEYFARHRKNSFFEHLFGRKSGMPVSLFYSAVYYQASPHPDDVYEISPLCRYICQNNRWTVEQSGLPGTKSRKAGEFMRGIDACLRKECNYAYPLQQSTLSKLAEDIVKKELAVYRRQQQEQQKRAVSLDFSVLQDIRDASEKTRDKLIVQPEEESGTLPGVDAVLPDSPQAKSETAAPAPSPETPEDSGLNEEERHYLTLLICGENPTVFLRQRGLMDSLLADSINEKLFDRFGDTVLLCDTGSPELIADYTDELKGLLNL